MKRHLLIVLSRIVYSLPLWCAVSAALLCTRSAQADFIISVQSVSANAGSSGNTLDVTLTNTGPDQTIGGFAFEISTTTSNINFSGAFTSTTTAPYIFDGNSSFGPEIDTSTGQTLDASDFYSVAFSGVTVGNGVTVGLGQIQFDVAAGTSPGPIPVTLIAFPTTNLSDENGNDISFANGSNLILEDGAITVNASAVPEPSTLVLAFLSCPAGLWMAWRQRTAAARAT